MEYKITESGNSFIIEKIFKDEYTRNGYVETWFKTRKEAEEYIKKMDLVSKISKLESEKIDLLTDFYLWMKEKDYSHNIKMRVEKRAIEYLLMLK